MREGPSTVHRTGHHCARLASWLATALVGALGSGCGAGAASGGVALSATPYPGDRPATARRLTSLGRTYQTEVGCAPGEPVDVTGLAPGIYAVSGCGTFRDYRLACRGSSSGEPLPFGGGICDWVPLPDLRPAAASALGCASERLTGRAEGGLRVVEGCGSRATYAVRCAATGCGWAPVGTVDAVADGARGGASAGLAETRGFVYRGRCVAPRWSASGARLACVEESSDGWSLLVLGADGRRRSAVPLATAPTPDDERSLRRIAWREDGGAVAFVDGRTVVDEASFHGRVYEEFTTRVVTLEGRELLSDPTSFDIGPWGLGWHPEGDRILMSVSRDDGEKLRQIAVGGDASSERLAGVLGAWSPDGDRIARVRSDRSGVSIVVARANGARPVVRHRLPAGAVRWGHLRWSPDGRWLAATWSSEEGARLLFVRSSGTRDAVEHALPGGPGLVVPRWLPDSSGVLAAHGPALLRVPIRGRVAAMLRARDRRCRIDSLHYAPRAGLAYSEICPGAGASSLRVVPATDPRVQALAGTARAGAATASATQDRGITLDDCGDAKWSPTGQHVAFVCDWTVLHVLDPASGDSVVVDENASGFLWSPRGDALAVDVELNSVRVVDLTGRDLVPAEGVGDSMTAEAWNRSGSALLLRYDIMRGGEMFHYLMRIPVRERGTESDYLTAEHARAEFGETSLTAPRRAADPISPAVTRALARHAGPGCEVRAVARSRHGAVAWTERCPGGTAGGTPRLHVWAPDDPRAQALP